MVYICLVIFLILCIILFAGGSKNNQTAQPKAEKPKRPPLTDAERVAYRQAEEVWDRKTASAILDGTYDGPLPEHVAFELWTNLYPDIYHTSVAGINFRRGIKDLAWSYFDCKLVAEPKNKHDPNAIKIVHAEDGRHIGYIPADETAKVRQFLSDELPHSCRVHIIEEEEEDDDTGRTRHYLIGEVNITRTPKK